MFVAALAFFAMGAASRGLWHGDEHRIAEVAREMAAPDGDFIVPHLDGAVYTHKPPLVAWIAAFAHGTLGLDLVLAARLPSILGGALAALATFLIGRRLYGPAAGAAAAIVLATAAEFDWICRRAQYDPLLAGLVALALWSFIRSRFPAPDERVSPWRDAVLGSLLTGLGILVKGPVALLFTGSAIVAFSLVAGEGRRLLTPRAAALLLVLAVPSVWLAAVVAREGSDYAHKLVVERLEAQTGSDDSKSEPIWYYLIALPVGLLPWTFLLPAGMRAVTSMRRGEERRADLFVLAWLLVPLALMSFVSSKRDLYLLPLYPAAALCVGKLAAADEESLLAPVFALPRFALSATFLLVGGAAALACGAELAGVTGLVEPKWPWVRDAIRAAGTTGLVLLGAAGAVVASLGWQALRAGSARRALDRLLGAAFLCVVACAVVVLPSIDVAKSPRGFYERAARIVGDAPIARYGVDDFAPHWTMRRTGIPYLSERAAAERFLSRASGPAFLVAEQDKLDRDGWPAGASVELIERLPLADDLVLLRAGPP